MSETTQKLKDNFNEFFKFTTTRPVAILMVVIGVAVFGLISYQQLPLNLMPDISYPSLTVRTEYAGTAPEEVETTISRPIEQAVGIVDNLVNMSSVSKAGQSDVILEFSWNTDMNKATADVREKLDQVFLPQEVKRPLILRYDPSLDPIMRIGLYGERSLFYMRYLAEEDIKRRLETMDGVAAVKVKGGLEEEIRVEMNEQKMTLIGIDIQQVKNRLAQENINLAGGNLKEGQTEYLVRTLNEFRSVNEIADIVIGNFNGREIKIRDVANVSRTNKERELITRINGQESVEIEIFKEADANIVAVAKGVTDLVFGTPEQQAFVARMEASKKEKEEKKPEADKEEKKEAGGERRGGGPGGPDFLVKQMTNFIANQLPEGVKIEKLSDQSIFIENAVDEVKSTAIIGGVLAVLVLFIFLRNLTATLIVGISIPISVIATFAPMKIFDVSLNIMSLGGLALGIGMLVDNSIVVLESIARCREEGDDLLTATVRGVGEVGGAVFASTLTTIAVFFPIVFVEGVAGQVFGDMALTVVFSLLASLAAALFLIPMLFSRNTSQFVAGLRIDSLMQKNFLAYSSETVIERLRSGDLAEIRVGEKISYGVKILAKTFVEWLSKTGVILSGVLLFAVKFLLLPLGLFIAPVMALLSKTGVIKFRFADVISRESAREAYFNVRIFSNFWPGFLVNKSVPELIEDFRKSFKRYGDRRWFLYPVFLPVLLIRLVFYLFKFVFAFLMEWAFRFAHVFIQLIVLTGKLLFIFFGLILAGPAKLTVSAFNWMYGKLEQLYPVWLERALNNAGAVIGTMVVLFVLTIFVLGPRLGSELIPEVHQGEFHLDLTFPVGTPAERTDEQVDPIREFVSGLDGVEKVSSVIGLDKTETSDSEAGEHTATLTVKLKRASSVVVTEEKVIRQIREHIRDFAGVKSKISRPAIFSFKTPIEVEIHGFSLANLQTVSREAEERMAEIPGMYDVRANVQRGNPEVQIIYNRKLLAHLGLNVMDVASIVRNKVRGDIATEFKEEDRRLDVLVRVRDEDKATIEELRRIIINPGEQRPIPLEAVADIRVNEGPSEIRRVDQQRTAIITANISGRDLRSVSQDIYLLMRDLEMPSDFTFNLAGQNEEMETSLNSLMLALGLAIFLVYIVMASQFESILHPFIIIFTIPLALIGVVIFLYLFNIPLSIVVFLGLIMLAGIVVNNAIVLVDYINHLRDRGMAKAEAIITAGRVRLRPIIMTTSTTVLGLLPMALGLGDGAEIRTPMAITVIIGLITSTVLTLIVIPTVYNVLNREKLPAEVTE